MLNQRTKKTPAASVDGSPITDVISGASLFIDYRDGNDEDEFFALFGDGNGDRTINFGDFSSSFLPAFGPEGAGNPAMDSSGDGLANFSDFAGGFLPSSRKSIESEFCAGSLRRNSISLIYSSSPRPLKRFTQQFLSSIPCGNDGS